MNILLCPDKFKGSLTAAEVCNALTQGLKHRFPEAEILACPLADGGDGSLEVLARYLDVEEITVDTSDPLGRPMRATYLRSGERAYVELAAASGLVLLTPEERDCLQTSSFGTGLLMAHALDHGVREIYLFIGGSATNDGGTGIAQALGFNFLDAKGQTLAPIGENLNSISQIKLPAKQKAFRLKVVCDVDNPFFGPNGAAKVYAPQKGAAPAEVEQLDRGLQNLALRFQQQGLADVSMLKGAGAAGGIGGGMVALLGGQLQSGTDTFLEISELAQHIQWADWVITGEGKLDQQTVEGKLISGVCRLAQRAEKPLIGVCGAAEVGVAKALGLARIYTVMERSSSMEEAMTHAAEKLAEIGTLMEVE